MTSNNKKSKKNKKNKKNSSSSKNRSIHKRRHSKKVVSSKRFRFSTPEKIMDTNIVIGSTPVNSSMVSGLRAHLNKKGF
jgi:hypothetical protein